MKKLPVAYFTRLLAGEREENHENISQSSLLAVPGSKPGN
jgi:hypothetical protein